MILTQRQSAEKLRCAKNIQKCNQDLFIYFERIMQAEE